jgi:hypothetical protein
LDLEKHRAQHNDKIAENLFDRPKNLLYTEILVVNIQTLLVKILKVNKEGKWPASFEEVMRGNPNISTLDK